jgi:hypothetical protein
MDELSRIYADAIGAFFDAIAEAMSRELRSLGALEHVVVFPCDTNEIPSWVQRAMDVVPFNAEGSSIVIEGEGMYALVPDGHELHAAFVPYDVLKEIERRTANPEMN